MASLSVRNLFCKVSRTHARESSRRVYVVSILTPLFLLAVSSL